MIRDLSALSFVFFYLILSSSLFMIQSIKFNSLVLRNLSVLKIEGFLIKIRANICFNLFGKAQEGGLGWFIKFLEGNHIITSKHQMCLSFQFNNVAFYMLIVALLN